MKQRKCSGCPLNIALMLLGDDLLRKQAPSRGAFYMWRQAGYVPWHAVGPKLLEMYSKTERGRWLK